MTVATVSRAQTLFEGTQAVKGQVKARQQMAVLLDRQWAVADGDLDQSGGAIVGGRSGSGKTMLGRLMCRISGLPFAEVNATRYTEAGYAGLDLAQMFIPLLDAAARMKDERDERRRLPFSKSSDEDGAVLKRGDIDEIVELASSGVILLDEFDKWMLRVNHVTGQKDTPIQADLLKMVEGSQEYVSDNTDEVGVMFDTTKVLIICAGAFVSLQGQVARRLDKEPGDDAIWDQITQEDFVKYGLIPELAGRLAVHIFLRPLRIEHMTDLLMAPGGPLAEYRQRFEAAGVEWGIDDIAARDIAGQAMQAETGARAIDHVLHRLFSPALYRALTGAHGRVTYTPHWAEARLG